MNRSDIVNSLSELYPQVLHKDIDTMVKSLCAAISVSIYTGRRVEIRGFGCFSLKKRAAGIVRNPKNGETMQSGNRLVVYFRAGKSLRERVSSAIKFK